MNEAIKELGKINEQQREYIKVIKGDIESLKESYKIAHEYNEVADKEIERLNKKIEQLKSQLQQKENIIKEVREYINKHCVNEKVSKEVGFKCYTMADTNELEHIMKILGDNDE